ERVQLAVVGHGELLRWIGDGAEYIGSPEGSRAGRVPIPAGRSAVDGSSRSRQREPPHVLDFGSRNGHGARAMSKPSTVARTSAVALAAALAWGPAVGAAGAAPACGAFHRVPAPSPGTLSNEVDAVAAASPHAAWAVGNWSTASKEGGLILRFDGHSWK